MNKGHVIKDLSAYLDNQLSQKERERIEEHLRSCQRCARELSHLMALSEKLKAWQAPDLGPFFEQAIKDKIAAQGQERGVVKMNKKRLILLFPSGVLAGILVFLVVGVLMRAGFYGRLTDPVIPKPVTQPQAQPQPSQPPVTPSQPPVTPPPQVAASMPSKVMFESESLSQAPALYGMQKAKQGFAMQYFDGGANGYWNQYYQRGEFNTEEYDRIYDNEFLQAKDNPLSTFSIDVDTASFSNVRRFLNNNQLPPKDTVRIEELINYFSYDYPQPSGDAPFSVTTEVAGCPWNKEHELVLIGLQGKEMQADKMPPSNLVFLIDVSGSMDQPNKLPLLQSAFKLLVDQLRAEDKVSIVVYAGSSGLVLDSVTGDQKQKIMEAINRLKAGGSTAGGEGLRLAYETAKKNHLKDGNNRVILATDGDFNVGMSSDADLVRFIEEKRDEGVFLTVLGFGMGNYKDAKMEKLADKGNGSLAYIDSLLEAKKVFVTQLTGTLFTIAKDVKIQVEFNPAKVKAYRLVGYENRMLKKEDFNDDKKDAGEIGAGHSVTALYEIVPVDSKEQFAGADELQYQQVTIKSSNDLLTVKLRYKEPKEDASKLITKTVTGSEKDSQPSENLAFASAVAEFGLLLRDSQYKGDSSYQDVLARARAAKGKDADGYRAEFIKLAEIAELLGSAKTK